MKKVASIVCSFALMYGVSAYAASEVPQKEEKVMDTVVAEDTLKSDSLKKDTVEQKAAVVVARP